MENMFADPEEIRARCRSTPTIAERRESESSIETGEMRVSHNGPITADIGVQVGSNDLIFQFPDIYPSPYDLFQYGPNRSPPETRSVPQSPYSQRGSRRTGAPRAVSWGKSPTGNGDVARVIDPRFSRRTARIASSPQLNATTSRTNGHFTEIPRKETERRVMKATSLESVSTDLDDVCDSLVYSLHSLTAESGKLHEENSALHQENVRLATQNQKLLSMYKTMKKELTATQKTVNELRHQLKTYHPENDD
jgi:hypothetical protein